MTFSKSPARPHLYPRIDFILVLTDAQNVVFLLLSDRMGEVTIASRFCAADFAADFAAAFAAQIFDLHSMASSSG